MPTAIKAWNSASTVNGHKAGTQRDVQTVQLANGDYWVIWNDNSDGGPSSQSGYDMVGQRFNALGEPQGDAMELNSVFGAGSQTGAFTAAIPGGSDFIMGYQSASPTNSLTLERKAANGAHVDSVTLASADATTFVRNADVAVANSNNGLMIFERSNDAGDTDIKAIRFNPTTMDPIGGEIDLSGQTDDATAASITVLGGGSYAIVYQDEYNGSTSDIDIKGTIVKQDGTATAFAVAGSTAYQVEPAIAAVNGGGFVVTWTEGTSGDIRGAMFNSAGVMQGGHFTIAEGANLQNEAQVVGTSDGGFVVAWEDDSAGMIMVQSYGANALAIGAAVAIPGGSEFPLSLTALADGRVLLSWDNGDAKAQIFDPRAVVNAAPAYAPDGQQIGTVGADVFEAASEADIVHGWDGDDVITDGEGNQAMIAGDAGDDIIKIYSHDVLEHADGGTGVDGLVYLSLATNIKVDLAAGTSVSGADVQKVTNFENFEAVSTVSANVTVIGTDGGNILSTGGGTDVINGGAGADIMAGRTGGDTYFVDNVDDQVIELANEGYDTVRTTTDFVLKAGVSVENLQASDQASKAGLSLTGNEFDNSIFATAGADTLSGGGGNDNLVGNGGNDELNGGSGNDYLAGGAGNDIMTGGDGNDFYYVDSLKDVIVEAAGEGSDAVIASISYSIAGLASIEAMWLDGPVFGKSVKFVGNGLSNTIQTGYGDDILNGGAGIDYLYGSNGNDRYIVDNEGDQAYESPDAAGGIDKVEASVSFTLASGLENLVLTGNAVINGTGNAADNNIVGNSQGNVMDGGMGADILEGRDGNDRYVIDNTGDKILETATGGTADVADAWISYSIAGQYVETLRLMGLANINATGNNQANAIFGNSGDNVIKAAGGDDKLYGGEGNDMLTGGSGADRFIFDTGLGAMNVDQILDFSSADDAIYLDRDVFAAVNNGALNASAFVIGSEAKDSNDRIVYDKANGDLYYDADGSGAGAAFHFASVADNMILTSADFIGF